MSNKLKATFYGTLQTLMFIVSLPFQYATWMLTQLHPVSITRRIMQGPYYWACVRKRRALGEEEWQEHDLLHLGVQPPEGHSYWRRMADVGIIPAIDPGPDPKEDDE